MEFVDPARHARHIAYRISCSAGFLYRSDKGSAMRFGTGAAERLKQCARVLEALGAVRHDQPTVPQAQASYLFIVNTKPPDMPLEPAQRRKEYDPESVWCAVGGVKAVSREGSPPSFVRHHGSRGRERDT